MRVPDPDGVPARARRRRRCTRTTSSRPRTSSPSHGPSFGPERWEEQSGYSPSTIAAEIAGLVAAAEIARTTTTTRLGASLARHRRRLPALDQGLDGDDERPVVAPRVLHPPFEDRRSERGDHVQRRQRRPDARPAQTSSTPASSSSCGSASCPQNDPDVARVAAGRRLRDQVRHGERRRLAPLQRRRLRRRLRRRSSVGAVEQGTGHLWPALSAERAEQDLATDDKAGAAALLLGMKRFASGVGLIPEQDWEYPDLAASPFGTDPTVASIGFQNGGAAGSASPLTWSAASFVRLAGDLDKSKNVVLPKATTRPLRQAHAGRDDAHGHEPGRQDLCLRLARHRDRHDGARKRGLRRRDEHRPDLRDDDGLDDRGMRRRPSAWTRRSRGGTTVLNVVAVSASGATAHAKRTVVFDFVPGTILLDFADPNGDDNGPGTYAYPTDSRLPRRRVRHPALPGLSTPAPTSSSALQTRDLTPTFSSPLGAQLVDVYVHVPGASPTSTRRDRSDSDRNYSIAPAYAWSRLIEVQGFGQRYQDASGNTARHDQHLRERDLAVHHVQRVRRRRSAGPRPRLVLHGRAHRPGRLLERIRRAASSRRRRTSSSASARRAARADLQLRPEQRAEGGRRADAAGREPGDGARTRRSARSCCRASRSRSLAWRSSSRPSSGATRSPTG